MDVTKTCFKCGRTLPISKFYKLSHARDGYMGKCKDCTKEDVRQNYAKKSKDEAYMEKERVRGREKYLRLYSSGQKSLRHVAKESFYPSLRGSKKHLRIKCSRDFELHHWNYNLIDSVIIMPRALHHRLHTRINLNLTEGIYYQGDIPLDTVEKHLGVLISVCDEFGYDFSVVDTTYI